MTTLSRFSTVSAILLLLSIAPAAEEKSRSLLTTQDASGELAGWKSFSETPGTKTADVWKLADGVLACKGKPRGYIYTDREYKDFVLRLEWRWPGKPGSGGVLIRSTGENKIWPKSLEAQINAGQAGDFWGLGYSLSGPEDRMKVVEHPQYGKLTNLKKLEPAEKPAGEWNQYEIIAEGGTVTLKINGKLVNQATNCETAAGRIVLTAEGDAIEFRNVTIEEKKAE